MPMRTPFNFIDEANLTASNAFHGDKVSRAEFLTVLRSCIENLQRLDAIKKAVFYGRELSFCPLFPAYTLDGGDNFLTVPALVADEANSALILHSIIGSATEASERLELLFNYYLDPRAGFDTVNFAEEIGDGHWYDAIGAKAIGVTFEEIQRRNIAKLRHRFPNKFTEHDANNRDLFGERAILSGSELPHLAKGAGHVMVASDNGHFHCCIRCEAIENTERADANCTGIKPEHDLDTPAGMSAANEGVDYGFEARCGGSITGDGTGQALPPILGLKPTVRIENWVHCGNVLIGDVIDHPKLGTVPGCRTSLILNLDLANNICETRNTVYKLGAPHQPRTFTPQEIKEVKEILDRG